MTPAVAIVVSAPSISEAFGSACPAGADRTRDSSTPKVISTTREMAGAPQAIRLPVFARSTVASGRRRGPDCQASAAGAPARPEVG